MLYWILFAFIVNFMVLYLCFLCIHCIALHMCARVLWIIVKIEVVVDIMLIAWWYVEWETSVALWLMLCCWILVHWSVCIVWVEPHLPCVRSLRVYDSLRARIAFREVCDPPLWMVYVKHVELVSGAWGCPHLVSLYWNPKKVLLWIDCLNICIQAQP